MFFNVFQVNHRTKMGHGFQFADCHKLPEGFPTKVSSDGQLVIVELPSRIPNWEPDFHNVGESTHVLGHSPISEIRDGTKPRKMTRRTHRFCYIYCIYIYIYIYIHIYIHIYICIRSNYLLSIMYFWNAHLFSLQFDTAGIHKITIGKF